MNQYVILVASLTTHLGVKLSRGMVVYEERFHEDHVEELVDNNFIKNLKDMRYFKVIHFEVPGLADKGISKDDVIREDFFIYAGEADSLVGRDFIAELTEDEIAMLPESTGVLIKAGTKAEPVAPKAPKPVKYKLTAADIAANPQLAEAGLKKGSTIELPYEGFTPSVK